MADQEIVGLVALAPGGDPATLDLDRWGDWGLGGSRKRLLLSGW
jgi:hypothetical protein